MNTLPFMNQEYSEWLNELKHKIKSAQMKTALAANSVLIELYWELRQMIVDKQSKTA